MQEALEMTSTYPWFQSRASKNFDGWVQFFTEWQQVVTKLIKAWPHQKIIVQNPHVSWESAYQEIDAFLQ